MIGNDNTDWAFEKDKKEHPATWKAELLIWSKSIREGCEFFGFLVIFATVLVLWLSINDISAVINGNKMFYSCQNALPERFMNEGISSYIRCDQYLKDTIIKEK